MKTSQDIREVPEMSPDPRVRVFRRTLRGIDEFEGMEVDAYVVLGESHVVILDTLLCPADMEYVMAAIEPELGNRQLLCVNSHADWDHTWGNGYFSHEHRIPILAHEHCLLRLNSQEARQKLSDYQARYPVFRDVQLVPPTLAFREKLVIVDGSLPIELLHAPGHCPDQIVAWLPTLRLLLAFDAVEKPAPHLEEAAPMFATLERLNSLDARHVLCSHSKTGGPEIIRENLAYLREIERRARLLLAKRRPAEAELEHTADLISYPFAEVIANTAEPVDSYYSWAHKENARTILQWLMAG